MRIPSNPPIPLNKTEEMEIKPAPHKFGISPPSVEPTNPAR